MIVDAADESAIQNEGGIADHILEERDTCVMKSSKMAEDMCCVVVVLNIFLAPVGTFMAAGLDKRGINKALLVIGAINLIPMIIIKILAANLSPYVDDGGRFYVPEEDEAYVKTTMINLYTIGLVALMLWVHGICLAFHIKWANYARCAKERAMELQ